MAVVTSAGLLLHRPGPGGREVLLGHLGGPFWARREAGAWSVPKGEHGPDEPPLEAARREFVEELGLAVPDGEPVPLGTVRQSRKLVAVWALEADLDLADFSPGTFELEWPPRSGRVQRFPELDRVAWVPVPRARTLLVAAQTALLDRLEALLA